MIRAVLWDNDGVLVDTERLYLEATRGVLAEAGLEIDAATYRRVSLVEGRSLFDLLAERGRHGPRDLDGLRDERNRRYDALLAAGVRVLDGVRDALDALHGRVPMAIVSSSRPDHFETLHAGTGLLEYFDFWLTSGDYARHKPHPDPYLAGAERIGVDPGECVAIEDTERGLRAASAAGMRCVVIPHELSAGGDFSSAWRVLDSAHALTDLTHDLTGTSHS